MIHQLTSINSLVLPRRRQGRLFVLILLITTSEVYSQTAEGRLPVIDFHVHANSVSNIGPPANPPLDLPYNDPANDWEKRYSEWYSNPEYINPASTDKELMDQTLEIFEKYNIYSMVCGDHLDDYIKNGGKRIIPGLAFSINSGSSPEEVRKLLSGGKYKVFGEIALQYEGLTPSDSLFEPYLEIADELDIPLAIHIGPGPPGAPYISGIGKFRARLNSPLIIEEALVRHPGLRVCIMHAGWPMIDDMLAILWTYPQVYVDVGLICYAIPQTEFYTYLKRMTDAGFGKRIIYGSDQMSWPNSTLTGINSIENAEFLTPDQKRDILYNNAARFLRLSSEEIAEHHSN
jgi:predicted TIM-barrel fold metal-dependent hydrolase